MAGRLVELADSNSVTAEYVREAYEAELEELADRWDVDVQNFVMGNGPIELKINDVVRASADRGEVELSGPAYTSRVIPLASDEFADEVVKRHPVPAHEAVKEAGHQLRHISHQMQSPDSIPHMAVNNLFGFGALAEKGDAYHGFEEELFEKNLEELSRVYADEGAERIEASIDMFLDGVRRLENHVGTSDFQEELESVRDELYREAVDGGLDVNRVHHVPMTPEEATIKFWVLPRPENDAAKELADNRDLLQELRDKEEYDSFARYLQAPNSVYDAGHLLSSRVAGRVADGDTAIGFSEIIDQPYSTIHEYLGDDMEEELDEIVETYDLAFLDTSSQHHNI